MSAAGWLVAVPGLAAVAGLGVWQWRRERRRRRELAALAAVRGWRVLPAAPGLATRWAGPPFGQGEQRRVANVVTGDHHGHPLTAFDYSYRTRTADGQGGRSTTTHRFAVYALHLPTALPDLQVTPETLLTRLGGLFGGADVQLESEEFNRRFRVRCGEPRFAYDVLGPRSMELLLSGPALRWRIEGADIIGWDGGELTARGLLAAADTLASVLAGIPSYVWRDHGAVPGPPSRGGSP